MVTLRRRNGRYVRPDYDSNLPFWAQFSANYDDLSRTSPAYSTFSSLVMPHQRELGITELLDVGCGTGRSGEPFLRVGSAVDGIDYSPHMMREARKKGYRDLRKRDLSREESLRLRRRYNMMISVGVLGDYLVAEDILPMMIAYLRDDALLAFTTNKRASLLRPVQELLSQSGFRMLEFETSLGFHGSGVRTDYLRYYVASRGFRDARTS